MSKNFGSVLKLLSPVSRSTSWRIFSSLIFHFYFITFSGDFSNSWPKFLVRVAETAFYVSKKTLCGQTFHLRTKTFESVFEIRAEFDRFVSTTNSHGSQNCLIGFDNNPEKLDIWTMKFFELPAKKNWQGCQNCIFGVQTSFLRKNKLVENGNNYMHFRNQSKNLSNCWSNFSPRISKLSFWCPKTIFWKNLNLDKQKFFKSLRTLNKRFLVFFG